MEEKAVANTDPDPTAVACYGLLVRPTATAPEQIWLRFATGRPVSGLTTQFLAWCCERPGGARKTSVAPGVGQRIVAYERDREKLGARAQSAGQIGGERRAHRSVPAAVEEPMADPIEPTWVHGKRAVLEPARVLTKQELIERVCAYYGCAYDTHLSLPEKAA
ncbi:MAG: hypothetical protein NVSMB42_04680 [Herpetosiphon sp.]